jgi:hypothetical protein
LFSRDARLPDVPLKTATVPTVSFPCDVLVGWIPLFAILSTVVVTVGVPTVSIVTMKDNDFLVGF